MRLTKRIITDASRPAETYLGALKVGEAFRNPHGQDIYIKLSNETGEVLDCTSRHTFKYTSGKSVIRIIEERQKRTAYLLDLSQSELLTLDSILTNYLNDRGVFSPSKETCLASDIMREIQKNL